MQSIYPAPMTKPHFILFFSAIAMLGLTAPSIEGRRGLRASEQEPPPPPPRASEQDRARRDMLESKSMPFSIIKRRTESAMAEEGTYLGVAPSPRDGVYRMQFLRKDGRVIWVDVDGKTGDIIARTR
jgi:hypothetical protein